MKKILGAMRKACEEFDMIQAGDRIAVGVSGGKDSMLLLYAMGLYKKYIRKAYTFIGLTVDLGFSAFNAAGIAAFADSIGVELHIEKTNIAQIVFETRKEKNPCALCSKMRKGAFYAAAKQLGCNKAAFAHNLEDVLETLLMGLLFEGRLNTFAPVTYLSRTDITLIRPFIYLEEKEILGALRRGDIPVYKNPCPADGFTKRAEVHTLLNTFLCINPNAKKSMLAAIRSAGNYPLFHLPPDMGKPVCRDPQSSPE